jgi:hypothetical protein
MRRRDERGFAAAEWVAAIGLLLVPTYIAIMTATRIPEAQSNAQVVATEAARAGAQANSCAAATDAATAAAATLVPELGLADRGVELSSAGTDWQPGGSYRAEVTMPTPLVIIPGGPEFAIPGVRISASHREPIDAYRFLDDADAGSPVPCSSSAEVG